MQVIYIFPSASTLSETNWIGNPVLILSKYVFIDCYHDISLLFEERKIPKFETKWKIKMVIIILPEFPLFNDPDGERPFRWPSWLVLYISSKHILQDRYRKCNEDHFGIGAAKKEWK